ncbi:MAG: hypothetical protein IT379_26680 [Deltaproteobacteria bacterium]|nr:hypothetical protein [Deltaproteobacteria bacterium]
MAGVADRLRSYARAHQSDLGSDDPAAVLQAEQNLAEFWTPLAARELAVEVADGWNRVPFKRGFGAVEDMLFEEGASPSSPASFGFCVRESELQPLPANRPANRQLLESNSDDATATLCTLAEVESHLLERSADEFDWGVVALGYGPALEAILAAPLLDLGEEVWRACGPLEHRLYGPVLRARFEGGNLPTLVTLEATLYLLRRSSSSSAGPAQRYVPIGRRYYLAPKAVSLVGRFREARNALLHQRRTRWGLDEYRRHCQLLFARDSFAGWLEADYRHDGTGVLAADPPRNLLGALIAQKHLWRELETGSVAHIIELVLQGALDPEELVPSVLERLIERASLAEVAQLVRLRVADATWRARKIATLSARDALEVAEQRLATPDEFPELVRRRLAQRASLEPGRLRRLVDAGWFRVGDVDPQYVASHIREPTKVDDALWLVEHGVVAAASISREYWRACVLEASHAEAARLVTLGIARIEDFPQE